MKILLTVLLLPCVAFAQAPPDLPDAPAPKVHTAHKFFDAPNAISTFVLAGTLAYDGYAHCYDHQLNSATASYVPFVRNCEDFIVISALAFGGSVGLTAVLHASGHHKWERAINWLTTGAAAYGIYYLKKEK